LLVVRRVVSGGRGCHGHGASAECTRGVIEKKTRRSRVREDLGTPSATFGKTPGRNTPRGMGNATMAKRPTGPGRETRT